MNNNAHQNAYAASVEERIKFGNRVLFKRVPEVHYAWMSDDRIVLLKFYSVDPDGFLKKYLEKYPTLSELSASIFLTQSLTPSTFDPAFDTESPPQYA